MSVNQTTQRVYDLLNVVYDIAYTDITEQKKHSKKTIPFSSELNFSVDSQLTLHEIDLDSCPPLKQSMCVVHAVRNTVTQELACDLSANDEDDCLFAWTYPDNILFDLVLSFYYLSLNDIYSEYFTLTTSVSSSRASSRSASVLSSAASSSASSASSAISRSMVPTKEMFSKLRNIHARRGYDEDDSDDNENDGDDDASKHSGGLLNELTSGQMRLNLSVYRHICGSLFTLCLPDKVFSTPRYLESGDRYSHVLMRSAYFAFLSVFVEDELLHYILRQQRTGHEDLFDEEFFSCVAKYVTPLERVERSVANRRDRVTKK